MTDTCSMDSAPRLSKRAPLPAASVALLRLVRPWFLSGMFQRVVLMMLARAASVRVRRCFAGLVLSLACMGSYASQQVPDFKLLDANMNSPRHGKQVSPRDYLLQVSGYYFGDAG